MCRNIGQNFPITHLISLTNVATRNTLIATPSLNAHTHETPGMTLTYSLIFEPPKTTGCRITLASPYFLLYWVENITF